jgi:hypothetical protein
MADVKTFPAPFVAASLKMPDPQHSMSCVSRALSQLTQGFVSAGLAQLDLARTLITTAPEGWTEVQTGDPSDVAHHWLKTSALRFDTTVKTYRKINDDLAASLFAAADSFWDAASEPVQAAPAARRAGAPKSG